MRRGQVWARWAITIALPVIVGACAATPRDASLPLQDPNEQANRHMAANGRASIDDILLLFIYLELGAMGPGTLLNGDEPLDELMRKVCQRTVRTVPTAPSSMSAEIRSQIGALSQLCTV